MNNPIMHPSWDDHGYQLQRLKAGDDKAKYLIYHYHYTEVFQLACALLRNQEIAEEVTSYMFNELWKYGDRIKSYPAIKPFLFIKTRFACHEYLKTLDEALPVFVQVLPPFDETFISDMADHTDTYQFYVNEAGMIRKLNANELINKIKD